MNIYESAEDYLETILMLEEKNGVVHSIDVAQDKGYSKASVSIAMKKLRENGFITMEKDGALKLLAPGREIAERIYERHKLLTQWLTEIGVDEEIASQDACKIEHDLSEETFQKLKEYINNKAR